MIKDQYKMMKVTSIKLSVTKDGIEPKIKKGLSLINLAEVASIFQADGEGEVEIVMNFGDRFIVKNQDIHLLQETIDRIRVLLKLKI
jgi:hypothetical protein